MSRPSGTTPAPRPSPCSSRPERDSRPARIGRSMTAAGPTTSTGCRATSTATASPISSPSGMTPRRTRSPIRQSVRSAFRTEHWDVRDGGWMDSTKWVAGDFDGDGRCDIAGVWNDAGSATFAVFRSIGLHFAPHTQWKIRDGGWGTRSNGSPVISTPTVSPTSLRSGTMGERIR